MIETILSIIIITLFVGTLTYILVEPGNNTKRSKLFDASTTDNAEDASVVMKRAINGNIINGKSFLDIRFFLYQRMKPIVQAISPTDI